MLQHKLPCRFIPWRLRFIRPGWLPGCVWSGCPFSHSAQSTPAETNSYSPARFTLLSHSTRSVFVIDAVTGDTHTHTRCGATTPAELTTRPSTLRSGVGFWDARPHDVSRVLRALQPCCRGVQGTRSLWRSADWDLRITSVSRTLIFSVVIPVTSVYVKKCCCV